MTTAERPEAGQPPQDIAQLIKLAIEGQEPARSEAFQSISEIVQPVILQAMNRLGLRPHQRDEFHANAIGHIYEKLSSFNPQVGSLEQWAYRVVYNLGVDFIRRSAKSRIKYERDIRRRRTPSSDEDDPKPRSFLDQLYQEEPLHEGESPGQSSFEFTAEQTARLEKIPPLRRVITLAASGLWRQVPDVKWQAWLSSAGITGQFPPNLLQAESEKEIWEILAAALGSTPEAVRQHFYRGKQDLQKILAESEE